MEFIHPSPVLAQLASACFSLGVGTKAREVTPCIMKLMTRYYPFVTIVALSGLLARKALLPRNWVSSIRPGGIADLLPRSLDGKPSVKTQDKHNLFHLSDCSLCMGEDTCFSAVCYGCQRRLPLNTPSTMAHTADAASALLSFSGQESDTTPVGKRRQAPTRRPRSSASSAARGKRKDTGSVSWFVAVKPPCCRASGGTIPKFYRLFPFFVSCSAFL